MAEGLIRTLAKTMHAEAQATEKTTKVVDKERYARAAEAYRSWREADLAGRATVLSRVADLHRQHDTELAKLMTLEMGKPIAQAKAEVELSATIYEYYATSGPRLLADEVLDIAGAGRALVRTAPIGPLLGIMAWNYP